MFFFYSHLLDVLHEQEKSANTNCGGNDNTATLKCKVEKQEDNVTLPMESTKGIKRWTTEEDLTEGLALQRKTQSLADFTRGVIILFLYTNELRFVHVKSSDFSIYIYITCSILFVT